MADNLTDLAENGILDHLFGTATFTVTAPIKVALMTVNGSDSTAGTEVTGGGYSRKTITVGAAAAGAVANTATVEFADLPACTVTGIEYWDSSGTPKRVAHAPLTVSKTVAAGDALRFTAGNLTFSLG